MVCIWYVCMFVYKYKFSLPDTEGINAMGASETMDMCLFTLTTLLSSFLIYNSKSPKGFKPSYNEVLLSTLFVFNVLSY